MSQRKTLLGISIVIAAALATAYWPVRHNAFVNFDDESYITENQHVLHGLRARSIQWAFTSSHAANWHPLTWLSHMLDCEVFGLDSSGHHLSSVVIHIVNSIILLLVLFRLTGSVWASALTAAMFALHPLRVESVAWAAERKDVLSGFFGIVTIGAYIGYIQQPTRARYGVILLAFLLGLMSKPMLVTLPFILILLDYWPIGRLKGVRHRQRTAIWRGMSSQTPARIAIEKLPLLILAAMSAAVTYIVQQKAGAVAKIASLPLDERLRNAVVSYVRYVKKIFWPTDLAVLYPIDTHTLSSAAAPAAAILLIAISLLTFKMRDRFPYLIVGWLWFLGSLIPVIGLVQVGAQAMADRYTYLPCIGILMALSWGLADLSARWPTSRKFIASAGVVAVVIMTLLTRNQVPYWKNTQTLFSHTLEVTENNFVAHDILGISLFRDGRLGEALHQHQKALEINPNHAQAHSNIGNVYSERGDYDKAIEHYLQALQIDPNFSEANHNLGLTCLKTERIESAIHCFTAVLQQHPDHLEAHLNLGYAFRKSGRYADALEHFNRAIELNPDSAIGHTQAGNTLAAYGEIEAAVKSYERAIALAPDAPEPPNAIAWIRATHPDKNHRDGAAAVAFAKRANDLSDVQNPAILDTLAAAYAETGQFNLAVSTVISAISQARYHLPEETVNEIRGRLDLYKQGKVYRDNTGFPQLKDPAQ